MAQSSQLRALRAVHIPEPRTRVEVFAFLVASGEPVAHACRMAGYGKATWSRNPGRILAGKKVQALIERYRSNIGAVSGQAARQAVDHITHLIATSDARTALAGCKALVRLHQQPRTRPSLPPLSGYKTSEICKQKNY